LVGHGFAAGRGLVGCQVAVASVQIFSEQRTFSRVPQPDEKILLLNETPLYV
jgi:hypothetical protein